MVVPAPLALAVVYVWSRRDFDVGESGVDIACLDPTAEMIAGSDALVSMMMVMVTTRVHTVDKAIVGLY